MRALRFIAGVVFALGLFLRAHAQSPGLTLDRSAGPRRLGLNGETNRTYYLESIPALGGTNGWTSLLTLTLTNSPHQWFDAAAVLSAQRFYRAVKLDGPAPVEDALNFRLIDHTGRSQELAYHTEARAIVLIFTGNGCVKLQQMLATIHSLRHQFASQSVVSGWWIPKRRTPG